jgi:hypothetical protein
MVDGVRAVETFWERVWTPPHDPDAIDELVAEEFVIVNAGSEIRGREAFKAWATRFQETIDDFAFDVVETFQNHDGTRVASLWRVTGRNNGFMGTEPDGAPIHLTGTAIWDVREDGKLLRNRVERSAYELHLRLTSS